MLGLTLDWDCVCIMVVEGVSFAFLFALRLLHGGTCFEFAFD